AVTFCRRLTSLCSGSATLTAELRHYRPDGKHFTSARASMASHVNIYYSRSPGSSLTTCRSPLLQAAASSGVPSSVVAKPRMAVTCGQLRPCLVMAACSSSCADCAGAAVTQLAATAPRQSLAMVLLSIGCSQLRFYFCSQGQSVLAALLE